MTVVSNLDDFQALDPFFRIIERGVAGSATPSRSSSYIARRRAGRCPAPTSSAGSSTFSTAVSSSTKWNAWKTNPTARRRRPRPGRLGQPVDPAPFEPELAAAGPVQPAQQVQQGGPAILPDRLRQRTSSSQASPRQGTNNQSRGRGWRAFAGLVGLRWLDPGRPDRQDADGAVAVLEAARAVDCPHQPALTGSAFAARLRHGWDGDPPLAAAFPDRRGTVAGVLEVSLPRWDNTHLGEVAVTIDPVARRQGLGTRLFEVGVERVHRAGRTLVYADCFDQPGPVAFLKAMGLDRAYEEVQRRQDLRALDWGRLEDVHAEAEARAAGYQVIRLPGATPQDMVPDIVRMTGAINDAPTDDLDIEDEVFSPERIRAFEAAQQAQGWRLYRLVARDRGSGAFAGYTMTAVQGEQPWYGCQYDTSVLRAHRGHRLGLLLKIGMLRWLAEAEPQLRSLDTWNAAANAHMIGINAAIGYRVLARGIGWQRHL